MCVLPPTHSPCPALVQMAREVAIRVSGATGVNALRINQDFGPTGETHNGYGVWRGRSDADQWLLMLTTGKWAVQDTADKEKNSTTGDCRSLGAKSVPDPTRVQRWKARNGSAWDEQAAVRARALSASELAAAEVGEAHAPVTPPFATHTWRHTSLHTCV